MWRNEDPALWDSLLCDLASAEMAARLAYPITQSASLAQEMRQFADRALREAKAIARLEHPNIVPVHELTVDASGVPYFTMKLVQGVSFDVYFVAHGRDHNVTEDEVRTAWDHAFGRIGADYSWRQIS